jgi:acyl carrier protein
MWVNGGLQRRTGQGNRPPAMLEDIRAIVKEHARLSVDAATLADDADLYQAGLTSHASVNLMLALEDKFEVEFPDRMLRRGVFGSLASIRAAIEELTGGAA